ncbi:hypothetical protein Tco_0641647 [Tanacetum coccineum]
MMIMRDDDGDLEIYGVDVVVAWMWWWRGCGGDEVMVVRARGIIRISQLAFYGPGALNQLCTQPVCYVLYALSQYVLYALSQCTQSVVHSVCALRTQPVCALRTQPLYALSQYVLYALSQYVLYALS